MPSPEIILNSLAYIANEFAVYAIAWHILIAAFIAALLFKWRPGKKAAAVILAVPVISVSFFALISGNFFNSIVFFVFSVLLIISGLRMKNEKIGIKLNINFAAGIIMIIFGWIYPHFLKDPSIINYLYSAPTGLIPCPTLSMVIGFTLLFNRFDSKSWPLILTAISLFYGVFGIFRLKVIPDIGLLAGALFLPASILFINEEKKEEPGKGSL